VSWKVRSELVVDVTETTTDAVAPDTASVTVMVGDPAATPVTTPEEAVAGGAGLTVARV
jgi:hypothetical protein